MACFSDSNKEKSTENITDSNNTLPSGVDLSPVSEVKTCLQELALPHMPINQTSFEQMSHQLEHIQQTWASALNAAVPEAEIVHALVAMHLGHPELFNQELLWSHTRTMKNIFYSFAQQQPDFQALSSSEQVRLVYMNAPTFVLYMLAGYIRASDGLTQLSWLLANKVPQDVKKLHPMLVTPSRLNAALGLFSESGMEKFTMIINAASLWSLAEGYFLTLACLYIDNPELLKSVLTLSEWAHDMHGNRSTPDGIQDVIRMLHRAHTFLDSDRSNRNENCWPFRRKEIATGFTNEAEFALTRSMEEFEIAYGILPLDGQVARGMVDYAKGIPLPAAWGHLTKLDNSERIKHVLFSVCEGLSYLPISVRTRALTVNVEQARAIHMARLDTYQTLQEQISHFVRSGVMTDVSLPPCHDRKISVSNIKILFEYRADYHRLQYLLNKVKKLVLDKVTYQLLMLVVLTNGLVTPGGRNIQDQGRNSAYNI
jgi:cell fate (sporulation/competence/biofilm development) regulator YlbF (YheA/YmcA/DUF963 family)